jgi:hypothetical protein
MENTVKGDNVPAPVLDEVDPGNVVNDEGKSVKYDTYSRVLGKLKKIEAAHNELVEKSQLLEQDKLASEGKKDELIEVLKKRANEAESSRKEEHVHFARRSIMSAVEKRATSKGCIDVELLMAAIDHDQLNDCINDDFSVQGEKIDVLIDDVSKRKPLLFKKDVPSVKDGIPQRAGSATPTATSYKDMEQGDLVKLLKDRRG